MGDNNGNNVCPKQISWALSDEAITAETIGQRSPYSYMSAISVSYAYCFYTGVRHSLNQEPGKLNLFQDLSLLHTTHSEHLC